MSANKPDEKVGRTQGDRSPSESALRSIMLLMLGGFGAMLLFSAPAASFGLFLSSSGVGVLVAGAAALVGGLLGFLFGIPRTLQSEFPSGPSTAADAALQAPANGTGTSYRANTNLEQISDWLTKILVGVGLTQLTVLPSKVAALSDFVAQGLEAAPAPNVLATGLLVFYGICGFLFSYLWTRLNLPAALREADLGALAHRVEQTDKKLEKKLSDLETEASADAAALNLVQRHFNPRPDSAEVSEDDLKTAIVGASPAVKITIFYQAWDLRSKTWREEATKAQMERTIPVFRALIDSDVRDEYHMNHGQLGFALKDKREPDWREAETELTKAIELRDKWQDRGWLFYEFNRAVCRIMLFSKAADAKTRARLKDGIVADLATAATSDALFHLIEADPTIATWLKDHNIDIKRLRAKDPAGA